MDLTYTIDIPAVRLLAGSVSQPQIAPEHVMSVGAAKVTVVTVVVVSESELERTAGDCAIGQRRAPRACGSHL
jgi:hypothetical protein